MSQKINGRDRPDLTPDAIRNDGLSVAEHVRELGKKARIEADAVEMFAEQVASAIVEATSQVADRVSWLLENCAAARESMESHRAALSALPEQRKVLAPPSMAREVGLEGVERSLAELEKEIKDPPPPQLPPFVKR